MTQTETAGADEAVSAIVVRRVRFDQPADLDEVFAGDEPDEDRFRVAFSLTLPHLEPYLIRVYRGVVDHLRDPALIADVQAFIGQEAQHHRNHRRANDAIKEALGPDAARRLTAVEDELEADYQRFTSHGSARSNLVYAEGFEAMTCAWAVSSFERAAAPAGRRRGSARGSSCGRGTPPRRSSTAPWPSACTRSWSAATRIAWPARSGRRRTSCATRTASSASSAKRGLPAPARLRAAGHRRRPAAVAAHLPPRLRPGRDRPRPARRPRPRDHAHRRLIHRVARVVDEGAGVSARDLVEYLESEVFDELIVRGDVGVAADRAGPRQAAQDDRGASRAARARASAARLINA